MVWVGCYVVGRVAGKIQKGTAYSMIMISFSRINIILLVKENEEVPTKCTFGHVYDRLLWLTARVAFIYRKNGEENKTMK